MKSVFQILMAFMLCFLFSTVGQAKSQTTNKDVGITCVNQVFTPATLSIDYAFTQSNATIEANYTVTKKSDVQQIYAGCYDSGIGLINRESINYTQTLASEKQIYQKVYRHGIGKLYATKVNYRKNTR